VPIKLPELGLSGCSAKVGSRDLLNLQKLSFPEQVRALATDSTCLSIAPSLYTSIDTILPMTRNADSFGRIAVLHCLGDILAIGARPTDACVSYGFDGETILNSDGQLIIEGVNECLKEAGVQLCKAHTFRSNANQITLAVTGKIETALRPMEPDEEYVLILTKEMGAGIGCHLAWINNSSDLMSACEKTMMQDHRFIAPDISDFCHVGTTDISGFGLLGHLAILSHCHECDIRIKTSSVRFIDGYSLLPARFPHNCSAQRNQEDFGDLCSMECHLPEWQINLLYNAETSGPLACIVETARAQGFLKKLHSKGFAHAKQIGTIQRTRKAKVLVA